jgi:hypothetical protein
LITDRSDQEDEADPKETESEATGGQLSGKHDYEQQHAPPRQEHFNQLRFVNRQLYYETSGLEFKFNMVVMKRAGYCPWPESQQVSRFLDMTKNLPYLSKNLHLLRHIALGHSVGPDLMEQPIISAYEAFIHDSPEDLTRLAAFCREMPELQLRYVLPEILGTGPNWIILVIRTIAYYEALRHRNGPLMQHMTRRWPLLADQTRSLARDMRSAGDEGWHKQIKAPNLRFFIPLTRQDIRKMKAGCQAFVSRNAPFAEDDLNDMVNAALYLATRGF